ncbi:hypothetical protein D3C73_1055870 [compost metagenome]
MMKDRKETSSLMINEESIFALNICFRERGQYKRVSSVRFSFSPTKELAAIIDEAIIGIIIKKTGIMLFISSDITAPFILSG